MKTLALKDGDLIFKNGDLQLFHDTDEIRQSIELELGTNLAEWFLNEERGTDFTVFQGKPTDDEVIEEVARVIANEERVELFSEIEVIQDRKARKMTVKFTVQEIETGATIEQEVSLGGAD